MSEGQRHALAAANLERQGSYEIAASTWELSSHYPCRESERHWREIRAEFCRRWAEKLTPLLTERKA